MTPHVTPSDLAAFRARTLGAERTRTIGLHVRECADCSQIVFGDPVIRRNVRQMWGIGPSKFVKIAAAAAAIAAMIAGVLALWPVRESTPRPVPPPIRREPAVTSIRDGSLVLTMDAHGSLRNVTSPSREWSALAEAALRTSMLPRAELSGLELPAEVLRGGDEDAPRLTLLAPVAVAVESATPEFRWTAMRGVRYRVLVARDGATIAKSGVQSDTNWTPRKPLPRGATYAWQLTVITDAREWTLPPPDAPPARFRVLSDAALRELEAARAAQSHLVTGLVAARLGVTGTAARELAQFASEHRTIAAAPRLADAAARATTQPPLHASP
jgi:hypothetical protein